MNDQQPINEAEKLALEASPQIVSTLLSLAKTARKPSDRARAALKLCEFVIDLADAAECPSTLRGMWAQRALLENAEALKEYFEACENKKVKKCGGKQA
jgi:hypothetical protein